MREKKGSAGDGDLVLNRPEQELLLAAMDLKQMVDQFYNALLLDL